MRFLAEECCDAGIVASLRADGHDVAYLLERQAGISDDEVLQTAFVEGRILLTEDKDFGELVYRLNKPACGIILIRTDVRERHEKWPRLEALIAKHADRLPGHFVVVDLNKYRFRPLILTSPSYDQIDLWSSTLTHRMNDIQTAGTSAAAFNVRQTYHFVPQTV